MKVIFRMEGVTDRKPKPKRFKVGQEVCWPIGNGEYRVGTVVDRKTFRTPAGYLAVRSFNGVGFVLTHIVELNPFGV